MWNYFCSIRDLFKSNSENYRNTVQHKTDELLKSTRSRDELRPDIQEVNILLRDWILFMEDYLKFADENHFSDARKYSCMFVVARSYRWICLRHMKNVESNLKNSLKYIQRFVGIVIHNPDFIKELPFLPAELVSEGFSDEDWVDFIISMIDESSYIKKFRHHWIPYWRFSL